MKKCPNCRQVYSDDNQFCLNDGTLLSAVPDAPPTLPFFQPSDSAPTQSFVPPKTVAANAPADSSKWLCLIIGVMATALIALGIAFFVSRGSSEKETAKSDSTVEIDANQADSENKLPTNRAENSKCFANSIFDRNAQISTDNRRSRARFAESLAAGAERARLFGLPSLLRTAVFRD